MKNRIYPGGSGQDYPNDSKSNARAYQVQQNSIYLLIMELVNDFLNSSRHSKAFYANDLSVCYLRINQVQFRKRKLSGSQISFLGVILNPKPVNPGTPRGQLFSPKRGPWEFLPIRSGPVMGTKKGPSMSPDPDDQRCRLARRHPRYMPTNRAGSRPWSLAGTGPLPDPGTCPSR